MKLVKKVSAIFLALAIIMVMVPQMENIVKAADTDAVSPAVYEWNANDNTYDGDVITGTGISGGNLSTSCSAQGYTQGAKIGSGQFFTVAVPTGKFATITIWALSNGDDITKLTVGAGTEHEQIIAQNKKRGSNVEPLEQVVPDVYPGGETGTSYVIKKKTNEAVIYKVQVKVYDNETDVPVVVKTKVTVSGTITSKVSLENGTIRLLNEKEVAEGKLTLKSGTENQYDYVVTDVVGDGTQYYIDIESNAITEGRTILKSDVLKTKTFTVDKDSITDKNFELEYSDITNIWDFRDANMTNFSKQGGSVEYYLYKGLKVDVRNGKFAKGNKIFQINAGTKIAIPVTGIGTVKCTISKDFPAKMTLGDVTLTEKAQVIEASYSLTDSEIVLEMVDGSYLETIEITNTLAPITVKGAAIRTQTESWGKGIRFGGELSFADIQESDVTESGTLIGLANTVGTNNITVSDAGKTCVKVVRSTFIEKTDASLTYAAALINIPEGQLDTQIVARPYVIVDGETYYGDQVVTSYNNIEAKINTK